MSMYMAGTITIIYLLVLLLCGVNIGVTLMTSGVLGIFLYSGNLDVAVNLLGTTAFSAIKDYVFGVIPLFVMMGLFVSESGCGEELYRSANLLLRKHRGGLAVATVVANAIFAAVTGASIASAAVFSKISYPEMRRYGYSREVSSGSVAGSSVLGMLIPPSTLMIIYGTLTGVSIGNLFIAGIAPGLMLAVFFIITILIHAKKRPEMYGEMFDAGDLSDPKVKAAMIRDIVRPWPVAILILLVIGGMWGGYFTPTEAGGIGAFGALLLMIMKRKFTLGRLWGVLKETGLTCGSILFLLICAQMFARMLAFTGLIGSLSSWITNSGFSLWLVLAVFCLIQLVLGCLLDSSSILLLTIPVMFPVMQAMGQDLVWSGCDYDC